ncbi:MAG TPA: efflux RND transporter permease subunit [Candidatus Hydrogenedens sp.]|nr:efflux RND transporter permease subunit [Candidatus Hydrogenedens sp.]HOL20792.1 efflux RND transporter permease subunit [Candidatus Hydrogenedens sp.]HPP57890.1 efflux RND transporter permease subunit [Candidatus Hydrogenedens sp.]
MNEQTTVVNSNSSFISFPIRRPVTIIMIFTTIIVFGWRSYQKLPINLMPDISYPSLTVRTEFEGAAPEDVEKLVTRPLEEMLSIVSGLVEISSVSSVGLSEITLEFMWNTDMNIAQQDVRDRLDLFEPPKEVTKKPVILRFNPNLDPVIRIGLTPPANISPVEKERYLTTLRESVQRKLKSDLEAETGIAQVVVKGGQEEEIQILVDSKMIKSLGLSLDDIVRSLASQNINVAGGKLSEGKTEYIVRTLKEFQDIEDIKNVIISTSLNIPSLSNNPISSISSLTLNTDATSSNIQQTSPKSTPIYLKDVATVKWGTKERDTIIRIDGEEAIELEIYKEGNSNTVTVCNLVKDLLGIERKKSLSELINEQLSLELSPVAHDSEGKHTIEDPHARREQFKRKNLISSLPPDTKIHIISDQSQFIISSIEEVQSAAINGGFLALLILYLFLREIRSTFTIGLAIPISIITVFIPMFIRGISLNIMSLGGLALGIGMLVDNSIVVLESIARCREEGDSIIDSAIRGTSEVSSAVVASTLTTIAVFFPVAFVEGIAGQIFGDLALTVTFSLLASLLTALFLNPLLVSKTHFFSEPSNTQHLLHPFRIFLFFRQIKHKSLFASFIFTIVFTFKRHIQYSRKTLFEILRYSPRSSRWLNLLKIIFFPINILLKFISWGIINIFVYPLLILFFIIVSPIFLSFALCALLIKKTLSLLLFLPLELFHIVFESFRHLYRISLSSNLKFAPIYIFLAIALFTYTITLLPRIGQELIPPMKQGEFNIQYETRAGTQLNQTLEKVLRIENKLKENPYIERITLQVGTESSKTESKGKNENKATFTILLKDRSKTAQIQDKIIDEIRSSLLPLPEESIIFTLPTLFTLKSNLEVQIFGDDLNTLKSVGEACLQKVRQVRGVKDADISIQSGYPEILIQLDRELLAEKGLSPAQVANKLRTEIQGEIATKFNRGGDKIDIRVRTNQTFLQSINDLKQMSIIEGAVPVRLCDVSTIVEDVGPSDIRRIGQKRVALITANIEGRDLASVSQEVISKLRDVEKPREFFITLGGQNRELATSYHSLRLALLLATFLVYVVMASQFESIWLPILVMLSVPLAFIGVIIILFLTGTNLNIMVFLGSIILAGIVVNNAIVLIDYTNQLITRGLSLHDAIIQASMVRLRPIFMTTLTTVLGLLPMLLSKGEGSELRQPLALTVITGLSASTLLTLWLIPMAYYMFSNLSHKVRNK